MNTLLFEMGSSMGYFILIPVVLIILLALFLLGRRLIFPRREAEKRGGKSDWPAAAFGCFCLVFLLVFTLIAGGSQFLMWHRVAAAYKNGDYQVVEGYVENFSPMPYTGHADESFTIGGVKFSYSNFNIIPGYHKASSHGGLIKGDGQHLRIGYVYYNSSYQNMIVFIEQLP